MSVALTPAERRQLVQQLPPLRADDERVIQRFLDAIWAEHGLARASLDSYRRDLEGLARWRDGAKGGLAGVDRAGLFDYLAWRTRHGWTARSNARLLSVLRAFFAQALKRGERSEDPAALLESPELARSIFYSTDLDQEIPAGLYLAVAQVLAYVYQIRQYRAGKGKRPDPLKDLPIPPELRRDS